MIKRIDYLAAGPELRFLTQIHSSQDPDLQPTISPNISTTCRLTDEVAMAPGGTEPSNSLRDTGDGGATDFSDVDLASKVSVLHYYVGQSVKVALRDEILVSRVSQEDRAGDCSD